MFSRRIKLFHAITLIYGITFMGIGRIGIVEAGRPHKAMSDEKLDRALKITKLVFFALSTVAVLKNILGL
ncbi:hypothetical protein SAMN05443661_12110 [Natronobacterium gregoryi]|uniref:Uncharacterized protein n=2 Tax=Natronobacterium gregoryi TaxID=44930 RepID=L0AN40_NATGS|nr:hypothetical protein Natgr_3473 [Natronobacterium gregoryi SP2]ELY72584.1 hypothetical protein C490_03308 [Natronobacterium gregoryi SP2]PLK19782.1 hypothetical protein CYV19_12805 [Natronobacterium gregoryi SP2]SFJ30086.1 hypothetical protein SAMN05443661_12110 [Natronobacterium gregoryi]